MILRQCTLRCNWMRGAEQKEMTSDNRYYLLLAFEVITARDVIVFR